MRRPYNGLSALVLTLGLLSSCSTVPAPSARAGMPALVRSESDNGSKTPAVAPDLTSDHRILHVLNRLGDGPRPGDLERVKRMGLDAYVEQQLNPRQISDTAADQALATYRTIAMSTPDLVREYPRLTGEVRQKQARGEMSPREVMEAFPPDRRPGRIL